MTVAPARHFIGGEFRDSLSGQTFDVISPVTEQVVTTAARGDVDDVAAAVKAATDAFAAGDWSRAKPSFRRQVLMKAADLIDQRYPEINRLEALEMGHPIGAPVQGPSRSAWNLRFFAMEQELAGNHSFNRDDNLLTYTMCDPVGTFALISPWNAPFMLSTWKLGPAIAYGNSVVHKPSELSPLSIGVLGEIFAEAGLPAGAYNTVLGFGKEAGAPLVEHPDVIGVSFTGSPATARDIAARVAPQLKRTSFELGGKSAVFVFADADMPKCVATVAAGIFSNSGQLCIAGSRILVQRQVYDQFLEAFVAESKKWVVGDPMEASTRLGPVVSKAQYDKVMGYIELARTEGRVLSGGTRPPGMDTGYFVEPTIIVDAAPSARVCQEEIFGPVAVVVPFDSVEEGLAIANDSEYGLAGYIWTESQTTAHYVAARLQTGMIWVNCFFERDLRQPFGGVKHSGLGREGGGYSREFFTETRFVAFPTTPR
ncbi:MAG: aldehyde dehydrogenase [Ilumatobacteraceae bacterium]|nr:aldehyde dehydrogenase [Ilumatobacteraceae bacterium]MBP7887827.1 aldehyde dehydrogenase [Ilumatobacteraceae bacterium]MBP8210160.1 aldehyde dehydrogenase [Ilumatobacteraceae bacterium]HQY14942.1 aldehyde dehydrogenase [Ilumatobacteraceae bacterium]HQY86550.1 aldehyde dehydrogenase [Ilumatobacteraceae bacterium]